MVKHLLVVLMSLPFVFATPAFAEGQHIGEAHLTLANTEYVRVLLNGEEYSNYEFGRNGKLLIVTGLNLNLEHNRLTLTPFSDALAPEEVFLEAKDFKRARKGRVFVQRATKTIKFNEKPAEAPKPQRDLDEDSEQGSEGARPAEAPEDDL